VSDCEEVCRRGSQGRMPEQKRVHTVTSEGLEPKLHPAHAIPATLL
jgi:hypothetical protein